MEQVRYRAYAPSCPPDLEMVVTARRLSENRTMSYIRRSHLHPSWAPYPEKSIQRQLQLARTGGKKRADERSSKPLKLLWNDPEIKRRGRVATYKMYGAEGRVKRSLKKGYSWFKRKCLEIVRHI